MCRCLKVVFFYIFYNFFTIFLQLFLQVFYNFLQLFAAYFTFLIVFDKVVECAGDFGAGDLGGVTVLPPSATFVVYVSLFSPRAWLHTAFTYVGPKVLVSYYGHSYGTQFVCWGLSKGRTAKAVPTKRGGGGGGKCALSECLLFFD